MRHLAIGDVHGCDRALGALTESVRVRSDDVLIFVGDYVDNGPHSCQALDWLIRCRQHHEAVFLRGNHDLLMLRARESKKDFDQWIEHEGDKALASYGLPIKRQSLDRVPEVHWRFLEATQAFHEIDTHFFVHANADPDLPLDQQTEEMLYWEKFDDPPPHRSGKIMICGHTSQKSGLPLSIGHAVCIDTRVYDEEIGWLTCLDVAAGKYWQANQAGQTRMGALTEGWPRRAAERSAPKTPRRG